jgi:hypothetical protein
MKMSYSRRWTFWVTRHRTKIELCEKLLLPPGFPRPEPDDSGVKKDVANDYIAVMITIAL